MAVEYPAESFTCTDLPIAGSKGNWVACQSCADLIEHDDWHGLAARATETFLVKHPDSVSGRDWILPMMQRLHAKFREFRTGPARPVGLNT